MSEYRKTMEEFEKMDIEWAKYLLAELFLFRRLGLIDNKKKGDPNDKSI